MTTQFIFLNGEVKPAKDCYVSCQDRGLLLGDGCFETLRCYQGRPFALPKHLERLALGCSVLRIPFKFTPHYINKSIKKLLAMNQLTTADARIRITITRGVGGPGLSHQHNSIKPTLFITTEKILASFNDISVLIHPTIKINQNSPLRLFKPISYSEKIVAKMDANTEGLDEAILLNTQQDIVSTTCGNLFLLKKNKLFTPPTTSGCLPGVMRHTLIHFVLKKQIECIEKPLSRHDVEQADSVFHTNSIREIQFIKQINQSRIPLDSAFANSLRKLLQQHINSVIQTPTAM